MKQIIDYNFLTRPKCTRTKLNKILILLKTREINKKEIYC